MNAIEMRPKLIGKLSRYCRNRTLAEEVVDEAIVRVIAMGDRRTSENVWPLMKTIAVNLLRDDLKRKGVAKRRLKIVYFSRSAQSTPVDHAISRELRESLEAALAGIGDREREAFKLCKLDGLSCQEAAQAMQITSQHVRTLIFRAKQQLRAFLEKFAA